MAMIRDRFGVSERRACRVSGQARSTQRLDTKPDERERRLVKRLHELVIEWPRRGYKYMTKVLRAEGWRVNHKRVLRLWRREGLKVPRKACRKRRLGNSENGLNRLKATRPNEVWAWDFFHDRLESGAQVKWLSLIDECTRECLLLHPARSIKSADAWQLIHQVMAGRGAPLHLRSDNGPEFIAKGLRHRLAAKGVATACIEPGSPWENGFAESFHSRVRDEFMNIEIFRTILEAKVMADRWIWKWNHLRLHGSLDDRTPHQTMVEYQNRVPPGGRQRTEALQNKPEPETLIATGT